MPLRGKEPRFTLFIYFPDATFYNATSTKRENSVCLSVSGTLQMWATYSTLISTQTSQTQVVGHKSVILMSEIGVLKTDEGM